MSRVALTVAPAQILPLLKDFHIKIAPSALYNYRHNIVDSRNYPEGEES